MYKLIYRPISQQPQQRAHTSKAPLQGRKETVEEIVIEEIYEEKPKIEQSIKTFEKPSAAQIEDTQLKKEQSQTKQEDIKVEKIEPINKFEIPAELPKKIEEVKKQPEKQAKDANFMDDLDSSFDESKQSDDR